jgi:desulfoferrodoxin (superoxide reductase-like protein)
MTGKRDFFLLLLTACLAAVQATFSKQTYGDAHKQTYVPSSHHANEVATKHTPTAEVTFDDSSVATVHVEVKHGSTSAHFIQSIFLFDQNGELYLMTKDKPIEDGSYDSIVSSQTFVLPKHVTEVTPHAFCQKSTVQPNPCTVYSSTIGTTRHNTL